MIRGRLSILLPMLLLVSMTLASIAVFVATNNHVETIISTEAERHINLDITRLQNILYNTITGQNKDIESARLNLSVTAMDVGVVSLFLTDEAGKILLANRYSMEGTSAKDYGNFNDVIARTVVEKNKPEVIHDNQGKDVLYGYYPVLLKLEGYGERRGRRLGVLYIEYNYQAEIRAHRDEQMVTSGIYSGVTFITAILISLILHFQVSRRLMRLNSVAAAIEKGDLRQRARLEGRDELFRLGQAFDSMADNLQRDLHHREEIEYELKMLNENLEDRISERTIELREAQAIAHIGSWNWDEASGDLNWSEEIYRIFGLQQSQPVNFEKFVSMIHPDDVEALNHAIEKSFETNTRYSIDHRIVTCSGDIKWVHEEGVPGIDAETGKRDMRGVIQDISERKRDEVILREAKEKAESANKEKSRFMSRMSHELRTPMNAILGFAQVLSTEELDALHHTYVQEILTAGDHLHDLIKELLDISSIEAGRLTTVMETFNVSSVVSEAVNLTHSLALEKNVAINNTCLGNINVISDKLRLREVLVNIIGNAIKYNRPDGMVDIRCDIQPNDKIHIVIQDTGPGLSHEQLDRIYEPFERLGSEYSEIEGTGLGLYLSRQMMEVLDGKLEITSALDQGTTATIEVNLGNHASVTNEVIDESETMKDSHVCKVLYIEDNPANVRVVEAMLKNDQNLQILTSASGEHGLDQARRYQPDIILLDINLPDIDGYEVLTRLKQAETTKNIPVIALTADAMPTEIERGLAAGFELYLTKPVRTDALINALKQYSQTDHID